MRLRIVAMPAALALLVGCGALPPRVHPGFQDRVGSAKTVALVPPDVKVYRPGATGKPEFVEEWSETARNNFAKSIAEQVPAKRRFVLKQFDPTQSSAAEQELRDTHPLFEAVAVSVLAHTCKERQCPDSAFQTKNERFEYSLGPLPALAQATGADVLLFVYARDRVSTRGQMALKTLVGFPLVLGGFALLGPSTPYLGMSVASLGVPSPSGVVIVALVDSRTGDVLWFNHVVPRVVYADLRDPVVVESLVADAFDAFDRIVSARQPRVKKQE